MMDHFWKYKFDPERNWIYMRITWNIQSSYFYSIIIRSFLIWKIDLWYCKQMCGSAITSFGDNSFSYCVFLEWSRRDQSHLHPAVCLWGQRIYQWTSKKNLHLIQGELSSSFMETGKWLMRIAVIHFNMTKSISLDFKTVLTVFSAALAHFLKHSEHF